jgi:hypothetical protein
MMPPANNAITVVNNMQANAGINPVIESRDRTPEWGMDNPPVIAMETGRATPGDQSG